jgi:hypothetical protein
VKKCLFILIFLFPLLGLGAEPEGPNQLLLTSPFTESTESGSYTFSESTSISSVESGDEDGHTVVPMWAVIPFLMLLLMIAS